MGRAGPFSTTEKGQASSQGKQLATIPCFGKTSAALHHDALSSASLPKAQFPSFLKLNAPPFPSLTGLRLAFLLAPPGAGKSGPMDREWLNPSSPAATRGWGSLLSATARVDRWASRSPFSAHYNRPTGAVLHPSLFQSGSGVVTMVGLGVWASRGLLLSELNYFFRSKHCKAVEPRVVHTCPLHGPGLGSPSSGVTWAPGGPGLCQQRSSKTCCAGSEQLAGTGL